jgi:hypothetical protein
MAKLLKAIPMSKLPGVNSLTMLKGVCCKGYLADIAMALRSDRPLVVAVANVCLNARAEFEDTFGVADFHSQQLVRLVRQLQMCEGRRAQIDAVFRITELLNAVDLQSMHWPVVQPLSRAPVFQPSMF